jgi:signal transduction histidine kinase
VSAWWPSAPPNAIAIDSRRQQILLAERGQQLAVLEERQRLARDLHDSVTQLIFSLMLIAQSVGPAYKRDAAEGERRLGRMLELSQQALAEMRALLTELRPTSPVAAGLLPALRQHVERVAEREKLHIKLDAETYRAQSPEREEMLYRVAQESLNNVIKHARAQTVLLTLTQVNGTLTLAVTDNGRGFNPAQATGGMGLPGMRERVERLGGALKVQSMPNIGTTICVTLPEPPTSN